MSKDLEAYMSNGNRSILEQTSTVGLPIRKGKTIWFRFPVSSGVILSCKFQLCQHVWYRSIFSFLAINYDLRRKNVYGSYETLMKLLMNLTNIYLPFWTNWCGSSQIFWFPSTISVPLESRRTVNFSFAITVPRAAVFALSSTSILFPTLIFE